MNFATETALRHRYPANSTNKANKSSDTSPGDGTATSQHQPVGEWQSDIDLSPKLKTVSPGKPAVDEKGEKRTEADKPSWRDWCNRRGLKAGDEDIAPLLTKPNETQKLLLDEGGKYNTLTIFPQALQQVLLDQALLMEARNNCQNYVDEARRSAELESDDLQVLQNVYDDAFENGASKSLLSDLDGKIQALTGRVERANAALLKENVHFEQAQKNVESGQRMVVDMLNGKISAQRLFGPGGQLAAPIHPLRRFVTRYPMTMTFAALYGTVAAGLCTYYANPNKDRAIFDDVVTVSMVACYAAAAGFIADKFIHRFGRPAA
jgi:hypothetical protein